MTSPTLQELLEDCAAKQKKGLHFIVASVAIWAIITAITLTSLTIMQKNLLVFCTSTLLLPLAWLAARRMAIDFQNKANALSSVGLLFTCNQLIYLLIVAWVFNAMPGSMLMVYTMVFGAHLLPFSWLYVSRTYLAMSIIIPILAMVLGLTAPAWVLPATMVLVEAIFALCLARECRSAG